MKDSKVSRQENQQPSITVGVEIATVTDAAESALLRCKPARLYVHGSVLARLVRNPPEPICLEPVSRDALKELLDIAATWHRETRNGGTERVMVPSFVAGTLLSRAQWGFPRVDGITDTPIFRPDGTIWSTPGYDADTRCLYEPTIEFPPIPDQPSEQEVQAALATLRDPFCDFPFEHGHDHAAAISAVLSLVARPAIDGPIPLYGVTSTAPGTGKGRLVDVISRIAIGTDATREVMPSGDEEMRKRILAQGIKGTRLVLLDNIDGPIGTPSLANVLTAGSFADRQLGVSRMIQVPMRAVWFATGNGLSYRGDLGRRVIPIELDAKQEHPENRDDFRHSELLDHVRSQRPALVGAALTLLRAYHLAGRPRHGQPRMGSFESWDDWIRALCIWVGLGDPAHGRERIRAQSDDDREALRALLQAWLAALGNEPHTAAQARARTDRHDDLGDELAHAWRLLTGKDALDTTALGKVLQRCKGRHINGYAFQADEGLTSGARRWRVVRAGGE
jgi:hypothetical protein